MNSTDLVAELLSHCLLVLLIVRCHGTVGSLRYTSWPFLASRGSINELGVISAEALYSESWPRSSANGALTSGSLVRHFTDHDDHTDVLYGQ